MKIAEVGLDALDMRYDRLSVRRPEAERKLLASLGESGQQSPLIVVSAPESGRYIVIDGYKRVRGLKRLKADVASVTVWEMDEAQALAASYRMSSQGGRNAFEDGWLVAELHRGWNWSLGAVAERLVRSKSWASKRLALVEELPEWMADEIASGRLGAHAAGNYLVPLTRVNGAQGRLLAERIRGLGLTNRQLGEIYAGYRRAGPAMRRRIVDDPVLYLKARAAAEADGSLSEPQNRCLKSLELVSNVSLGLTRGLPGALSHDGEDAGRMKLGAAWRRCVDRFALLSKTAESLKLGKEVGHAGQRDPVGDTDAAKEGTQPAADRGGTGREPEHGAGSHAERGRGAGVQGAVELPG
ncbi:MAG: ParB N-terminal domain-containing protein [Chloroflexota bacterium]